jgi:hypothetical protein
LAIVTVANVATAEPGPVAVTSPVKAVIALPPLTDAHDVLVPSVVRYLPPLVAWAGAKALNAALAVVCPVPPLAIGSVSEKYPKLRVFHPF